MQILMAARARGVQAIDGPFLQVRDVPAFQEVARRSAMLGFDGKWVLHPGQIDAANEIYAPSQEDYDHAELILDAYEWATSEAGGKKGSAMLGEEMIDEASRKMFHYILMQILMAARARGVQAIDGPFLQVRDVPAFEEVARRSAMLGFDGKWALHPDQIDAANEIYAPSQADYDHAELILDAYEWATSEAGGKKGSAMLGEEMIDEASRKMALVIAGKGGRWPWSSPARAVSWATSEAGGKKGSAMLGEEMIDEASRKMALVIAGKGRAAGLPRTTSFDPPQD
nr:aldolase/citrate lyase family protein [Modestobacter sp. Leaf380]